MYYLFNRPHDGRVVNTVLLQTLAQNGNSRLFKVTYFGVNEKHLPSLYRYSQ